MSISMETKKIENFTDLIAWKEAQKYALSIYTITKKFPENERFGLTNQIRRAVVSITSNVAEGFGRSTAKDKAQFYAIAKGSLLESQSQLLLAKDLNYVSSVEYGSLEANIIQIARLLSGLMKSSIDK